MASGVATNKDCVEKFNEMKKNKKMRYITFKLSADLKEVVVDEIGGREKNWEDFRAALEKAETAREGRYAVIDTQDSKNKDVLVFLSWVSDEISVKQKMLYASSRGSFKREMASGVQVKDDCKSVYETMKLRHNHSYIIFKISSDNKYIEIADLGEPGASYDSFVKKLEEAGNKNEGRYAVFDANIADKKNVLVFFMWIPDNQVSIRQKMLYTSSKRAIRDKLQGIAKELQCNDAEDLAWSSLVEKCQSKYD